MTKKIFRSTVAVGLAVLAASLVIIMGALYSYFGKLQEQQLKDELSIAAAAMAEGDGMSYLTRLDSDNYRITWLRADGVVLYDTRADAATMENHAQREEVRQALANGAGESSRYSNTMLTKMLYYAQRLPDGTVLRLSASRVTAGAVLLGMLQPILLVIAAALILSGLLASRVSKRIVEPLNRLDLEHPLENEAYEELSPLLRRLEHQRRQIDQQMSALRRRSEEFEQITASMTEGLVLLDNSGTVLSINPAAQAVLGTDSACVGQPLVAVERDTAVSRALRDAMENGRAETCYGEGRPGVPVRRDPHSGRRRDGGRGAADLRRDGADLRPAQPPGVHRQRLPRAENAPAGHHRQRRAAGKRHGAAGGYAPLRRAYPQRGPAAGDAHQRHHPPVRAGRGRRAAHGAGGAADSVPRHGGRPVRRRRKSAM